MEHHKIMKINLLIIITILLCCFLNPVWASEILWLSNTPPEFSVGKYQTYGMHRLSSLRGKRGSISLLCWLRTGTVIEQSNLVENINFEETTSFVFSPDRKPVKNHLTAFDRSFALTFSEINEGFYNVYLLNQYVANDTLYVIAAKADLSVHSCRKGHDKALLKKIEPKIYPEHIPLEIVRERFPNEDFHTFISSGDNVNFTIFFHGETVDGANITLHTHTGWSKSMRTNKEGKVNFQFINDYFSEWEELEKRNIFYYLVDAKYTLTKNGSYNNQDYRFVQYITTLSDGYRPSKTMYSSFVWSLLVFVIAIILPGIAIYIYRERRKKPFKEIAFNE